MEFVVWFIAWGFVCCAVAGARGRNPLLWFVIGAAISPLALIVLFALPNESERIKNTTRQIREAEERVKEADHQRRLAEISVAKASISDTYPCPYCAETIKRAAVVCRFCSHELAPKASVVTAGPAKRFEWRGIGPVTCPGCGANQKPNRETCLSCGAAIPPSAT